MEKYNRNNFNIESAINKEWCILCDTEEKANDFVNFIIENGYKWVCGHGEFTTYYQYEKENTCYYLDRGAGSIDNKSVLSWGNKHHNNQILLGKRHYMVEWEVV